jgi:TrmH family RNA methyltransferase
VPDITSRQHALVQAFKAAARGDTQTALLDGWHLLHDATDAGLEVTVVAYSGTRLDARDAALLARLERRADVVTVTDAVMRAMSPVRTPTGVAALARRRAPALMQLLAPSPALVIVAADIQDPGNVGAIVRSAEAGGATGVVFAGASADPWGWKALRASMGSTFRLGATRVTSAASVCEELRHARVTIAAAVARGGRPMHEVDMRVPLAVVLGAEGAGLDATLAAAADEQLTIPMKTPVESLNVAVAAALLVYEARRQRQA